MDFTINNIIIYRLKPENIGRILVNALECRTDKQMVIIALYLISTLVQYNKVVSSLCICPGKLINFNFYYIYVCMQDEPFYF
jgi:hypothetical protein